jgi:type I restriction enzyme R subunit
VSQSHAARITQLLNEEIELRQPKANESAFACQVTSQVTDRQAMTVAFSQNTLGGKTKALMDYDSSRVRVCVTVGMMTTGYDCEDLLNVVLMRPVFSPSEFVQMKGRGTRKHDFTWFNPKNRQTLKQAKITFHFFDFFASYEYFEEEYDYDQVKKISLGGGGKAGDGPEPPKPRLANDDSPDALKETRLIAIGEDGMKIDRMLWQDFSDKIYHDADIQRAASQDDWATVLRYIQTRIFQRPDKETAAETPDDGLSALRGLLRQRDERGLSALFSRLFGRSITFPTKDSLLDQAFERFAARHPVEGAEREDLRYFFKAYVGEQRIRDLIDSGRYGELNQTALPTERLKRLPGWRQVVADIRSDQLIEEFGEPG